MITPKIDKPSIVLLDSCSGQGSDGFSLMIEYCDIEISRAMLTENSFADSSSEPPPVFGNSMLTERDRSSQVLLWCEANGYTDCFLQEGGWWAFPPSGVMPVPLRELS